jgi:hypothetical protein
MRPLFLKYSRLVPATAVATVSAATISATTTATITAATTTTATISAATTTAAAAFAGLHRARFVDGQGTTVDFLSVELGHGGLSFLFRAHFDESKTAGTARDAVVDHLDPRDIARLGKEIGQVVFRHAKGQVAHIEFYAHFFPSSNGSLMLPESDLRCH